MRYLGYHQFLIRVNYKSGSSMEFWCYNFTHASENEVRWDPVHDRYPVVINVDRIESSWVIDTVHGLRGQKPS